MSLIPVLSSEEFTSLVKISFGPIQDAQIPSEHLLKLVGFRYIMSAHGQYEATSTGRFRIGSGS